MSRMDKVLCRIFGHKPFHKGQNADLNPAVECRRCGKRWPKGAGYWKMVVKYKLDPWKYE